MQPVLSLLSLLVLNIRLLEILLILITPKPYVLISNIALVDVKIF